MLEFRFNAFLNENSQAVLCFCWNSCLWLVADCRSCFWDPFVPLLSTAKLEPLFYFGLVRFTLLRLVTDVTDYQGGQEGIFARSLLSKSSSPQYHHWHHEWAKSPPASQSTPTPPPQVFNSYFSDFLKVKLCTSLEMKRTKRQNPPPDVELAVRAEWNAVKGNPSGKRKS